MLIDYHVHTRLSADSDADPLKMAEFAIARGIGEICFTEHKDLDPMFELSGFYQDVPYTSAVEELRERFGGELIIKKGVELDFQSPVIELFDEFIEAHRFDFVLASVHALEHEFIYGDYFLTRDADRVFTDYFREVLVLSKMTSYDVLGHLDYVKRHSCDAYPEFHVYEEIYREILGNVIACGKGLELNTAGIRQGRGEFYPSEKILRLYRDMGGEIITMGSDAHRVEDVGADFERGIRLLKELNFDGVYTFTDRKPVKVRFDE